MTVPTAIKFESILEATDSTPAYHILKFPKELVASFSFKGNLRRVICALNGAETYNCALFPSKNDYFITVNKKLRDRFGLKIGDLVSVELQNDTSKFGMPMPEEFAEVLRQDPEGDRLFNALPPGDQRLMLKLIVFVKDPDRRIARALAGIELLKHSAGKFDYNAQHLAMRIAGSPDPALEIARLRSKI